MGAGGRGRGRPRVVARGRASLHAAPGRERSRPHQAPHPERRGRRRAGGPTTVRIEVFIDDESAPRYSLTPPATLELDTVGLSDGPHRLRVHAIEDSGTVGVGEIPFTVRNGPGIAVGGLPDAEPGQG